jgi:hypothetical protein
MTEDTMPDLGKLVDDFDLPEGATRLPSGGWVKISDARTATGKDVRRLRQALNEDGDGNVFNSAMTRAMEIRVLEWEIPGRPNLRVPMWEKGAADLLTADDLIAIESLIKDWALSFVRQDKPKDDGEPGSPPPPARA